jgi:Ca2+-binding RTX toxin-like protein
MRRITTMATTLMLLVALSAGAAFAALVQGNNADNTLAGTNQADTIHAYGGKDLVWALAGRDEVRGGSNADHLYGNRYGDAIFGGKGQDRLYGGKGDDHLVGRDLNNRGIGQRDVLDCGPGYDTFAADYEDRVLDNCEEGVVSGF